MAVVKETATAAGNNGVTANEASKRQLNGENGRESAYSAGVAA